MADRAPRIISKARLRRIEEAAKYATPGPWRSAHGNLIGGPDQDLLAEFVRGGSDASFVAAVGPDIAIELVRGYGRLISPAARTRKSKR